jgi:hypothetical protein
MSSFATDLPLPCVGIDAEPAAVFHSRRLFALRAIWLALLATGIWIGALIWLATFLIWKFVA